MSNLVNRVRDAISDVPWIEERLNDIEGEARAAIAAVAEWMEAHEDFYANSQASKLRAQLEKPK